MATTIQTLAKEAAQWFETARRATGDTETGPREDGDEFVRLTEGRPEWIAEMVQDAHGDMFPDDWKYLTISAACEWIADNDDPLDTSSDFADSMVDVYTGRRFAWLASNLNRAGYCDEALENGMIDLKGGIVELIGAGQYEEAGEIYGSVLSSIEARLAEVKS